MNRVSIVIPVYDGATLTQRCLDTLIAQSLDAEIVVVDDASADETELLLSCYGDKINVVRNEFNCGYSVSCNVGVAASSLQGLEQSAHVAAATQLSHASGRVAHCAGDPAQHHLTVTPALDVAAVARHRAVEVLDRIGRAQGAVQRAGDAQRLHRQRLLKALAHAGRGPRVLGLQRRGQAGELLACQIGVRG